MKLAAPNEMKRLDEIAIKDYGIPGILLMENGAACTWSENKNQRKNQEGSEEDRSQQEEITGGWVLNGG